MKYILHDEGRIVVNQSSATYEYHLKDHLGNTRVAFQENGIKPIQSTDYYPFGLAMNRSEGSTNKYLYNGKEKQELTDWLDYGARMYDAQIGRWHVMDAVAESYFSYSPYNFVRNNPILRVDPNGKWDVTVHLYNNREQYGYGVAIVTNKGGDEIYRFRVRGQGVKGSNRTKTGADTPTGTYNIPNYAWINGVNATTKKRESYGKNYRLVMIPESGEIIDTGRDLIRIHGGRQEIYDKENNVWLEVPTDELAKTEGCLRASDADMIGFKMLLMI